MTKATDKTNSVKVITSINSKNLDKSFIKLEKEIRDANKSFLIIGANLTTINELESYKLRGFTSFETYVNTMFDFTRDYAYKIMSATRVYNLLKDNFKPLELPRVETHCRPLTKIDSDEDIIKIWSRVVASNKIQAKTVINEVNIHLGKGAIVPKDNTKDDTIDVDTGNSITGGSVQDNNTADELNAVDQVRVLEARVTELENELEKARSVKGSVVKTKLGMQMINAGFAALVPSATQDQLVQLTATKQALLG